MVGSDSVTYYPIAITEIYSKVSWNLEKRFSEFYDLYDTLKALCPNMPKVPSKTLFKITDPVKLEERRQGLEQFLFVPS